MLRLICVAMLFAAPVAAKSTTAMTGTWGKPGVSYDQYRRDAVDCALVGATRDVSNDEPAKRYLQGFAMADRALNMPSGPEGGADLDLYRRSIELTQPARQVAGVQAIMVGDVETCLTQRGYDRIQLSKAEQRTLQRLRHGTERRRRFLYDIAARAVPAM